MLLSWFTLLSTVNNFTQRKSNLIQQETEKVTLLVELNYLKNKSNDQNNWEDSFNQILCAWLQIDRENIPQLMVTVN